MLWFLLVGRLGVWKIPNPKKIWLKANKIITWSPSQPYKYPKPHLWSFAYFEMVTSHRYFIFVFGEYSELFYVKMGGVAELVRGSSYPRYILVQKI